MNIGREIKNQKFISQKTNKTKDLTWYYSSQSKI